MHLLYIISHIPFWLREFYVYILKIVLLFQVTREQIVTIAYYIFIIYQLYYEIVM